MSELPDRLEVEPGNFKALGLCSESELRAAAAAYLTSALIGVSEALGYIEAHGGSPVSDEIMNRAEAERELSQALAVLADRLDEN